MEADLTALACRIRDDIKQDHRGLIEQSEDASFVMVQLGDYAEHKFTDVLKALAMALEDLNNHTLREFAVNEVEVTVTD